MTHKEYAVVLRGDPDVHYNCAQATLIPYAEEVGMTREQAVAIATNFGGGMRCGAVCGAVTGALMVLGLRGYGEEYTKRFVQEFRTREGHLDCAELLKIGHERGLEKKEHCDSLVFHAVELADELMKEPPV